MGRLVDVERVEPVIGDETESGKVFVGWKQWVQNTHGAWFSTETLNDAREVARTELQFNQERPNVYSAINDWAIESGLNAYEANLLAGVVWSEARRLSDRV